MNSNYYNYEPKELVHPECPNFYMYEIFKSHTADRFYIDNSEYFEDSHRRRAADLTYNILQPLRNEFGMILLSSWYRNPPLCKQLCWKAYTKWCQRTSSLVNEITWQRYLTIKSHPTAGAVDLEIPGVISNIDLWRYIDTNFDYDQLILEYSSDSDPTAGWVHISFIAKNNPYTIDRNRTEMFRQP